MKCSKRSGSNWLSFVLAAAFAGRAIAGDGWFEGFEMPAHVLAGPLSNGWMHANGCPITTTPVIGNFALAGGVHTGAQGLRLIDGDDVIRSVSVAGDTLLISAHVWLEANHRCKLSLLSSYTPAICSGLPTFTEAVTIELDASQGGWSLGGHASLNGIGGSLLGGNAWVKILVCADLVNDSVSITVGDAPPVTSTWTEPAEPLTLAALRITGLQSFFPPAGASRWDSVSVAGFDTFPKPSTYCTAKVNSGCCLPTISAIGLPKANAALGEEFWLTCDYLVNQQVGMFIYSTAGPNSAPFRGGFLCLTAPIRRTQVTPTGGSDAAVFGTDCSGRLAFEFNRLALTSTGFPELQVAGTTVWAQCWARDRDLAPCFDPNLTQLSGGLEFVLDF